MKMPITPSGLKALKDELKGLKVERRQNADAIEVARGHGDLSENADYHAAKERAGLIEAKIRSLEDLLSKAEVVDPAKNTDLSKIVFGLSAVIVDLDTDEKRTVSVVSSYESDAQKGRVSFESPLGKALIGKQVGDVVSVRLPGGEKEFEVLKIFLCNSEDAA